MEQKKPKRDMFFPLKHIAYSWSHLLGSPTFDDVARYMQLDLCVRTNRLMKDEVWEKYTREEIMVEYFAHRFHRSKEEATDFAVLIGLGEKDTFEDWAEQEEAQQIRDREEKLKGLADTIKFSPSDVKG